jgi:hypothetical protein
VPQKGYGLALRNRAGTGVLRSARTGVDASRTACGAKTGARGCRPRAVVARDRGETAGTRRAKLDRPEGLQGYQQPAVALLVLAYRIGPGIKKDERPFVTDGTLLRDALQARIPSHDALFEAGR